MISLDDLYARDEGMCRIGAHRIRRDQATRDHIVPKVAGGGNEDDNIQLACPKHNRAKGARLDYVPKPPKPPKPRVRMSRRRQWDCFPQYGPIGSVSRSVL
jgi:5-methylcytosine-specific restriction endonuclease McrA